MFYLGHNLHSVNCISENSLNWCVGLNYLHYGMGGGHKYDIIVTFIEMLVLKTLKHYT